MKAGKHAEWKYVGHSLKTEQSCWENLKCILWWSFNQSSKSLNLSLRCKSLQISRDVSNSEYFSRVLFQTTFSRVLKSLLEMWQSDFSKLFCILQFILKWNEMKEANRRTILCTVCHKIHNFLENFHVGFTQSLVIYLFRQCTETFWQKTKPTKVFHQPRTTFRINLTIGLKWGGRPSGSAGNSDTRVCSTA